MTQELWKGGEISEKRRRILELIQTLSYKQTKKQRDEKGKEESEKETLSTFSTTKETKESLAPSQKRRRSVNGRKSFDPRLDKVIEVD